MNTILQDYLYSQISFSTYKFNNVSFLVCKYYLSMFKFQKKYYYNKISNVLLKDNNIQSNQIVNYYLNQEITALVHSDILISSNKKEINIYKKIKKNNLFVINQFNINYLSNENKLLNATLVVNNHEELKKYHNLINTFDTVEIIDLMDYDGKEFILDSIKQKILQSEQDIYFFTNGIYANILANFAFELNKIAICL